MCYNSDMCYEITVVKLSHSILLVKTLQGTLRNIGLCIYKLSEFDIMPYILIGFFNQYSNIINVM